MSSQSPSRSQAIFRLPVEQTPATMYLHDGTRSEVELFLPIGDTVLDLLVGSEPFLPLFRSGRVILVARSAIACLAAAEERHFAEHADLPIVRQAAQVHLRSGLILEGELRWLAPHDRRRTGDHLNESAPTIELYARGIVHHVVKAHIALVEEER